MRLLLGVFLSVFVLSQDLSADRVVTVKCTPAKCGDYGVCFPSYGCVCQANRAGEYCDVNVCQTSGGTCLDIVPPSVQAPPTQEISCDETNLSPTAEGTGAPFLNDNCPVSRLNLKVSNKVSRRPNSSCPNAAMITRTFNVSDSCGNWASDEQRIFVDDKKAPFVNVRLVPLPATVRSVVGGTQEVNNRDLPGALGSLLSGKFGSVSNMNDMHNPPDQVSLRPFSNDMGSSVVSTVQRTGTNGVAACNPPSTRTFLIACNISDSCSATRDLTIQARLRVVRVTNRNAFTLANNNMMMMKPLDASTSSMSSMMSGSGSTNSGSNSNVLNQLASLLGSAANSASSLGNVECSTATDFVDVSCGDTVTFENEREDSCLDTSFQSGNPWMKMKPMSFDDFEGGKAAVDSVLSSNGMMNMNFKANTVSVRGTALTVQVRVADECDNRAESTFSAFEARDTTIAGRECPAVSAAPARVNNNNDMMMKNDGFSSGNGPLSGGPLSDLFSKLL